ncbi:The fantastic four family [Arabidopsis thaliana x Arabidopsis arenosa]|uniref:The fantastic four family n=1 Tax=Arabidopsis thaliana x Arabidopsis arenosa TaxID=1240361 RepID=A0A8T1XB49_9BRAS|nr:The fantastic four family [Arabidopsis thaliana x Arabidopsis arenosa]
MLIMTSSSTILTGEDDEEHRTPSSAEDDTPTHSHRRRWSTPVNSGGESLQSFSVSRSLEIKSDHENPDDECREHRGGKISPWGPYGPPLLTESSRSNAPSPRGEERRGRSVTRKRDLPPFLTTLDCNGRPRFHHRRVRSEGRLEIASVAVDSPEIVSVRGREGLRIGTVRISQQNEEVEEDDDKQNH